jgi:tetratricopeptide (TPR) repeat protein
MLKAQGGLLQEALQLLNEALRVDPRSAEANLDRGNVLEEAGRAEEALASYDRALAIRPAFAEALYCRGNALRALKRHEEALASYERALAMVPGRAEILGNRGNSLHALKRYEEALASYDQALVTMPGVAFLHNNRGNTLRELKRPGEALASLERSLALKPDYVEALINRGNTLQDLRRYEEALASFDRALALKPDDADLYNDRGNTLLKLNRPEEGLTSYDRALRSKPDHDEALRNRGVALLELDKLEDADRQYEQMAALKPGDAWPIYGLGVVRERQGRMDEAVNCYKQALAVDGGFVDAQHNLAMARLLRQDFEGGWPGYERRLECGETRELLRKIPATVDQYERLPRWRGPEEVVAGQVGIWSEQGIGDQLLFSTLIPELIEAGVSFVYEVDRRLLGAYERAFPGSRFVALEDPPREALRHASKVLLAGSLPGMFRCSRESFVRQPRRLLSALPERVAHYRGQMDALGPGLKVALSWRSTRAGRRGREKSFPLMQFAPLLELSRVHFVDVQYGDTRAERQAAEDATGTRLLHFDEVDYFQDLEEVLAILEACDVLITTSNANAHFAGVLGKRVWLLYPEERPPFHYWAHDGNHRCLWYPSVEIVTAPQLADWASLIQHVKERLDRELTRANRHAS